MERSRRGCLGQLHGVNLTLHIAACQGIDVASGLRMTSSPHQTPPDLDFRTAVQAVMSDEGISVREIARRTQAFKHRLSAGYVSSIVGLQVEKPESPTPEAMETVARAIGVSGEAAERFLIANSAKYRDYIAAKRVVELAQTVGFDKVWATLDELEKP